MSISRRQALLTTLFGAGAVGLRSLATGLPVSLLLNPRQALAAMPLACKDASKAQFIILSTSGNGDPINASVPGTYEDMGIIHSLDPRMAPAPLTMNGHPYTAATPWSTLPQDALNRTIFWHIMTDTPVHPKEGDVLRLMGATTKSEMLPSLLAKQLAPCLNTIQSQPISIGAAGPSEGLSFGGQALPIIPPVALKATLTNPTTGAFAMITQLQSLRDQTMNQLYDLYKNGATPAQKAYVDSMATSQSQVRSVSQSLLAMLSSIKDNSVDAQITAALALIQMNVSPVIAIHIPFGGDNHSDTALMKESDQTVSGVQSIVSLLQQLQSAGLQDKVTFMSLNVFGRTLATNGGATTMATNGRTHNQNHQVSITIGKPFKGGVIGSCVPLHSDYGASAIDSQSGAGSTSGDIAAIDSLAAFGQTMLSAVGGDPTVITAPTAKVITGALA
jgi:hypothetical protein